MSHYRYQLTKRHKKSADYQAMIKKIAESKLPSTIMEALIKDHKQAQSAVAEAPNGGRK